jgi:hypothetical protein
MAGAGIKVFADGDVLDAADVNTYLMDQAVCVFATTTARDDAFGGAGEPTLSEGRLCYVAADNKIYAYSGSAWFDITANIPDDAVTAAKILNSAVTTAKINDTAVTTAKIADGAITSAKLGPATIDTVSGTTYTLVLGDASMTKKFTSSSAITVTVPTNVSVAFPTGSEIYFLQYGTGQITFAGAGGVTIRSDDGRLKIKSQYSSASLLKLDTNEWVLTGNLAA